MSNEEEQQGVRVHYLELDERNLRHFAERERGIDAFVLIEVLDNDPRTVPNPPRDDRSGSHLMIGPDNSGKLWTIVIVEVDADAHTWRPITGWPATPREQRAWERGG